MWVFVDESGDPGLKFEQGSSKYFVVTTVVIPTIDVAQSCDNAIKQYRMDSGIARHKEFHFSKDNEKIRTGFLRSVANLDFWFSSVVLNKQQLTGPEFRVKESLYKYTVRLAFENIFDELNDATVVFDSCGGREFGLQLKRYVQKHAKKHSPDENRLKTIKSRKSHADNLLQLADMICGAIARSYSEKPNRRVYRNLLRARERRVQVWP
ncbi:MAG: DUF3800 domain-containing protein [Pirellulaceae bacterium]